MSGADDDRVVYLDHNATTPLAPEALEAMLPYLRTDFGNPSSDHPLGHRARRGVERAREQVAALLGAHPDEVVFTSGGTESNNLAIRGTVALANRSRTRVVTSAVEHPATARPVALLAAKGWSVRTVPVTAEGSFEAEAVTAALGEDVALLSVMLAQNETGALMPVAEVTGTARDAGVVTHTDAAQAVGKIPVDVADLGIDLLSVAGHKLSAPKGVGALYVRRGTRLAPVLLGAGQERGLRPGTENVASIVALGAACDLASSRLATEPDRLAALRERLWATLGGAVVGLVRHTPSKSLPNTLLVSFPGVLGADVLAAAPGIAASTGSACHAGEHTPSSVLTAMGVPDDVALGAVRLSLGHDTTADDVDRAARALVSAFRLAAPAPAAGG
jgi:cysteine desulfurase